jgi:hypothetical protein
MKYAVCAVLLAACAQPVVDMTLDLPTTTQQVDLSCVTAVDLMPVVTGTRDSLDIGYTEVLDASAPVSCVDLGATPQSLDDVASQIRGKFSFGIPSGGLDGVVLRGREGTCKDDPALQESVFYGGGKYTSGTNQLPVTVKHNLSCDQLGTPTVAVIDMVALLTAKTCTPVDGGAYDGDVRPTLFSGSLPPIVFEEGPDFEQTTGGVTQLSAFQSSFAGTCPAIAMTDPANSFTISTCVNTTAATACAQPGQLEMPMLPSFEYAGVPPAQYAGVVMVGVWTNTGTKGPVMGATVTLDPNSDASIVYGTAGATAFTVTAGSTSTDATGAFEVYPNQVVGITVTGPGGSPTTHIYVGADAYVPGASVVVL